MNSHSEEGAGQDGELFRTIFQVSPDGMSFSRLDNGLFMEVNQSFCDLFGYQRGEVLGRTASDLHFWQDMDERETLIKRLNLVQQIDNYQANLVTRSGQRINALISARIVKQSETPCLLLSYKNISEQSQLIEILRESQKQLKEIFDMSPDVILITDEAGVIYDVNARFELESGHKLDEVIGRTSTDIDLWASPEQSQKFLSCLEQKSEVRNMEITARVISGEERTFYLSAKPVLLGGKQRILSIARDITENKSAENALRASETRYRQLSQQLEAILEGIPDSLILWSKERRIIWANRASIKLLFDEHDKVIGKGCWEFQAFNSHDNACLIHQSLSGDATREPRVQRVDQRAWAIKAFPVPGPNGRIAQVMTLATDITESLWLRDEASRSARLAALGELAAGVAHEINNPNGLTLMDMTMVQDVFRDLLPVLREQIQPSPGWRVGGLDFQRALDTLPDVFDGVLENCHRIRRIVEDLKEFSSPQRQDSFGPVNLNEVVKKVLRMLRLKIDKVTDHFAVNFAPKDPIVLGDSRQLEQVVINLIMNACQALRQRSECLVISIDLDAEQKVSLTVWDEGVGMDEKTLNQITDPFYTTRRDEGGTGLGLSISSRIVEEHKGHLEFVSTPGLGTRVMVQFPCAPLT